MLDEEDSISGISDIDYQKYNRVLETVYANQQKIKLCIAEVPYIRLVKYNDGKYLVDEKTGAVFSPEFMIIGRIVDNKSILI